MNSSKNDHLSPDSKADQSNYIPPEITVLDIKLEQGFAASSDSNTADWDSISW